MSRELVELKFAVKYSGTRFAVGFMPRSSLDSVIKTNEKALERFKQRTIRFYLHEMVLLAVDEEQKQRGFSKVPIR